MCNLFFYQLQWQICCGPVNTNLLSVLKLRLKYHSILRAIHAESGKQLFVWAMHIPRIHVLKLHLGVFAWDQGFETATRSPRMANKQLKFPEDMHFLSTWVAIVAWVLPTSHTSVPIRSMNSRARSTGTTNVPCFIGSDLKRPMATAMFDKQPVFSKRPSVTTSAWVVEFGSVNFRLQSYCRKWSSFWLILIEEYNSFQELFYCWEMSYFSEWWYSKRWNWHLVRPSRHIWFWERGVV